ncbi:MAG: 16S rRNA processing protein RimM [Candidatus Zixiibacteriota bacterium]|nr:MAG: 16S rRNA processing protein RimM [candidate division Zixibacteria bacterium]
MKISVAYIKGPRGFRGELAAVLYSPMFNNLREGMTITLEKGEKSGDFVVEFIKPLTKRIGLKLRGIEDQDGAEFWKGAEVLVEKDKLVPLNESEFYHFELEGTEIYGEDGELIGIVKSVDSNVANAILNVESENREIMIPFVKAIVKEVNIKEKKIVIRKIEGLF